MMDGGCINLLMGKRGEFYRCKYWQRNSQYKDLAEYKHKVTPQGTFYAKKENSTSDQKNEVSNVFMYDNSTLTISTRDNVKVKPNDLVLFDDEMWMVKNVQSLTRRSNEQFMKRKCKTTYIQLAK